jgi:four helix bundle protein
MSLRSLPIWRDANRFLLAIEQSVKQFPRYHKYTLGSELRKNALIVCNTIVQAWHDKSALCCKLMQLTQLIDEIKIQLHLAKRLGALQSFASFESLALQAVQLGKQSGGWYKTKCKAGQNGK